MAKLEIVNQPNNRRVIVTLSRRNLLALLHKLDWEPSGREIQNGDCWEDGEQCPIRETTLVLRCEDDDEHYAKRDFGPGVMIGETELYVQEQGGTPGTDLYI